MANGYMPRKDAEALDWMRAFAKGLSDNPGRYMVTRPDADTIARAVERFERAYRRAKDPATRTVPATDAKLAARASAEGIIQIFYGLIKVNAGISNKNKLAIGVRPLNRKRSRIACPQAAPALGLVAATSNAQLISFCDSTEPTRKAKPYGALALQLVRKITDDGKQASDPDSATLVGTFTTTPMTVPVEPEHDRKKATYWGRWISRRGETGMWSLPISVSVAA